MYIVTNGIGSVQRSRWARAEIRDCFLDLFISEELGYEKPAREYFDLVAEKIPDFDRKKTLLIGDSLSSDMRGGQNAGIDTCWFCPSSEAKLPDGLTVTYRVRNAEELYALLG
jgi:2-haloacid dehalogenase